MIRFIAQITQESETAIAAGTGATPEEAIEAAKAELAADFAADYWGGDEESARAALDADFATGDFAIAVGPIPD